jgi:hypothetical protein
MIPFTKIAPADRAELKAVLFALLVCGVFIALLNGVYPRSVRIRKRSHEELTLPTPLPPHKSFEYELPPPPPADSLQRFRVVPENFRQFDFKNHWYGLYSFPNGIEIDLTLYESELILPNRSGWFSLRDVYYKDVTGDGRAEAIVRLSHVKCGGACSSAELFYIYSVQNGLLKTLWQYETGSYGYRCGLKSFTVTNRQLVVELFGWCPKPSTEYPLTSKFMVKDLTFSLFEFDGQRFSLQSIEYFPTSPTNVKSYEPAIRFF